MRDFIGKPQMLKEVNTSLVEQMIYEQGPLSKPELSKLTRLSLPTVNKLVDDLEKNGSVCQVGLTDKGAGRKAVLYGTNKNSGCLIALYYQWEKYICRIADITGETIYEGAYRLDNGTAKAALKSTVAAIDAMIKKAPTEVKSIGVGVPGVVMPDGQLSGIPKISVWEGFNLEKALAGRYNTDITVENDVKLSTVGYYHNHLSEKHENIVYVYAGNGMGSGIIINKKLYRGSANFSGEIGFMAPLGDEYPHKDYTATGGYLEGRLRQFVSGGPRELVKQNAPEKREILANILGAAAANYVAILNPDAIVFGGEAIDEALVGLIREKMSIYSPAESMPYTLYDSSDSTGIEGLLMTCQGAITTRMQLVQDGGV